MRPNAGHSDSRAQSPSTAGETAQSGFRAILQSLEDGEYRPEIAIDHREFLNPDSAERYLAGESDPSLEQYLSEKFQEEVVPDLLAEIEEDQGVLLSSDQEEQVRAMLLQSEHSAVAAARDGFARQTVLPMRTRVQDVTTATDNAVQSSLSYEVPWKGSVYHGRPDAEQIIFDGPIELVRIDTQGNLVDSITADRVTVSGRLQNGESATTLDDSGNPNNGISWSDVTGREDYPTPTVRSA